MSISKLYESRCRKNELGELKPTFWKPEPLKGLPICFYSDVSKPSSDGIEIIRRLIGLALKLEVEAGELVLKGIKKELPKASPKLIPLLKSNAADESRHFRGFQLASEAYGDYGNDPTLTALRDEWLTYGDSSKSHPIHTAGLLELSVFLISLGVLRIVGNTELTNLSLAIAEDEFRHVNTNVAVSRGLGFWGRNSATEQALIDSTIEWVWGDGIDNAPSGLTLDNLKRFSRELVQNLESKEFDSMTWYSVHNLPFELSNSSMYQAREFADV